MDTWDERRGKGVWNLVKRNKLVSGAVLAVIAVWAIFWFWPRGGSEPVPVNTTNSPRETVQKEKYSRVRGNYIFSGTIVLGRAVEKAALHPDGSYDNSQPFSKLNTLNFNQYDAGVIDLECPSTGRRVSYEESVANLIFDCHPDWFPQLGKYFQIMNLAGNHTYDAGADGFSKTVQNIQDAGMQAIGHYRPRETDDICEVVSLPVKLQLKEGGEEQGHLPLAMCAYHYQFGFKPQAGELEQISRYTEVMPVIGLMHAGAEYQSVASNEQREYARAMIDNGAEFVIGNGAHWVQDTEVYKDKLIVYSTGNFIFDQIEYESRLGLSIAASMYVDYDSNLSKWLEMADSCQARDDNCYEKAQRLEKYQPEFEFDAVSSFGGYQRVTEKANEKQQQDIKERANWEQTLKELGQERM